MIDHVTLRVEDLDAAGSFYDLALALLDFEGTPFAAADFREWDELSIARASAERPATRGLHVGLAARSPEQVDAWWRTLTDAGYPSDGEPGTRPEYGPAYYGAFVLDPAGNSVEAVHDPPGRLPSAIDHLWLRVRDLDASTRFYETLAPLVDHRVRRLPGRTALDGEGAALSLLAGPPSEHVHLAFAVFDRAAVDAFHARGLEAGYRSLGAPGERPRYHPGCYAAYLEDPDGHNVEAVFHDRPAA